MAGINDTAALTITGDDGTLTLSGRLISAGSVRARVDIVIPAGAVDVAIAVSFPQASLDTLQMLCDQNCIVKFNSASVPVTTINLYGGWPYFWNSGDGYFPHPLSVDVTGIFVSAPGPSAHFQLKALSQ